MYAQGISNEENREASDSDTFATFQIAPTSVLSEAVAPLIEIARKTEARDLQGNVVENALNFNLGMQITPVKGLNVSGGVWRQEIDQRAQNTVQTGSKANLSRLYIDDSLINEFNIDDPALGTSVKSERFNIGASNVWETET